MTAPKLVLHPDSASATPDGDVVIGVLEELGIVGAPFVLDDRTQYRTGPAFLDHITFLGCAPSLELDPPPAGLEPAARAGLFCHIGLTAPTAEPRIRHGAGKAPRCRSCRADFDAAALQDLSHRFRCPRCGQVTSASGLNWRQTGGCACVFLEFWGIHTGEAVPGEQLLERLGPDWRFFYIED